MSESLTPPDGSAPAQQAEGEQTAGVPPIFDAPAEPRTAPQSGSATDPQTGPRTDPEPDPQPWAGFETTAMPTEAATPVYDQLPSADPGVPAFTAAPPGPLPGMMPGPGPAWGTQPPPGSPAPFTTPGYPSPLYVAPPQMPRRTNPKLNLVIALVVIVAVIGGVYLLTNNQTTDTPQAQPTLNFQQLLPTGASPAPAPTSSEETATCVASLAACLMTAPKNSSPWTNAWGKSSNTETASQFATHFYSDPADAEHAAARLGESGVTAIVKRTWSLPHGEQADDELLSFSTVNGATSWHDQEASGSDGTSFTIPGQTSAQGSNRTADSGGVSWSVVDGESGSTDMELWVTTDDHHNDPTDATSLATTQMQLISSKATERTVAVATTPAVPPYTGTGHGAAACVGGTIDDCLVPAPSGSTPWSGSTYFDTTNISVQQFVADNWGQSDQANEVTVFQNAGVGDIAHRDWTGADATGSDVALLQYGTAAQAEAQTTTFEYSMNPINFDVPGITSAEGQIFSMNDQGDVEVQISASVGRYEIVLNFFSPATADIPAAAQLFEQQYALLPTK